MVADCDTELDRSEVRECELDEEIVNVGGDRETESVKVNVENV
jgi:hypothetical protein